MLKVALSVQQKRDLTLHIVLAFARGSPALVRAISSPHCQTSAWDASEQKMGPTNAQIISRKAATLIIFAKYAKLTPGFAEHLQRILKVLSLRPFQVMPQAELYTKKQAKLLYGSKCVWTKMCMNQGSLGSARL